jgi:hypothetical protein
MVDVAVVVREAEVREGGKRAGSWEAERAEAMEAVVRAQAAGVAVEAG